MKIRLPDWPLWLLMALTILLSPIVICDFAADWLTEHLLPKSWLSFSIAFVLMLAIASAFRALLGFWVSFLPVCWWVRISVLLAISLWLGIWDRDLAVVVVSISAILASSLAFVAAFRCKYRLAKYKGSPASTVPAAWRFSLSALICALTIIVMFFALPRVVAAFNNQFVLAVVLALPMAPTAGWAMLGQQRIWLPVTATVISAVGYALIFVNVENKHFIIIRHESILAFVIHTFVLLVMLGTVRLCGYRLQRVARRGTAEAVSSEREAGG